MQIKSRKTIGAPSLIMNTIQNTGLDPLRSLRSACHDYSFVQTNFTPQVSVYARISVLSAALNLRTLTVINIHTGPNGFKTFRR